MSKIDEYIARRSQQSTEFAKAYKEENQQLQVAVEVRERNWCMEGNGK